MKRERIERPIEVTPEKLRELQLSGCGDLLLPMSPQPVMSDKARAMLVSALIELGMLYSPGDSEADLLDAAFREGVLSDLRCPWGRGGDVLWCREPWAQVGRGFLYRDRDAIKGDEVIWLPAARMPREAARTVLKIEDVGIARDDQGRFVWRLEAEVCR